MKVLLLSDTYSEHTEKWALGLAKSNVEVGLFSFNKASYEWYDHKNITVFFEPGKKINAESSLTKLAYLKYVTVLKKIIKHFQPDILHAHYATSYGLVGALSGFHPFVISAWGTDVMKFPNKNFVAKSILSYNFKRADVICATSNTIKEYISQVVSKPVQIVPFGIDVIEFSKKQSDCVFIENEFVLGSIKPLEAIYRIDVLIKSFAALHHKYENLRLLIIGEGTASSDLEKLCIELNVIDKVKFTGRIPFNEISNYYNKLDVLVNLSEYESFGVSVIEAMACEKPVIVTNVGGLKEIVKDNSLGFKVEVDNIEQTINAIEALISDKMVYNSIAMNARKYVIDHFNWNENLKQMLSIYAELLLKDSKTISK